MTEETEAVLHVPQYQSDSLVWQHVVTSFSNYALSDNKVAEILVCSLIGDEMVWNLNDNEWAVMDGQLTKKIN